MQADRKNMIKRNEDGTRIAMEHIYAIAPCQIYEEVHNHSRSQSRNNGDVPKYAVKNIYPTRNVIAPFQICEEDDRRHGHRARGSSTMKRLADSSKEAATKLCNRMIMCIFAVLLLFGTSLQVCVAIVGTSIKAPSFSSVVKNCKYAFGVVQEQSDYYAECTERQIATCKEVLDAAYIQETFRVQNNQQSNAQFLNVFQNAVGNCSSAVTLAKGAVSAWTAQGVKYEVPYNGNCTGAQKQAAVSLLGGSTAQRTNVYVAANSYTQASDNTVIRLATYSVALNSYNAEYLSNKTRSLQRLAQQIVDQAALPHVAILGVSFDPVLDVINTLLACVSLSDSAGSCPYPNNLLNAFQLSAQAFTNIYKSLENSYLALLTSAESYKIFVTAAIRTVNQFYTSIQGAQGLVSYLSNTLGVGNICGKTNPNFCSFNPSMWSVSDVYFPSLPLSSAIATASQIWSAVSSIPPLEILKIKAMAAKLKTDLNVMVQEIKVKIAMADFTPNDYNPPSYPNAAGNVTFEIAAQAQRSSNFAAEVQGLLSATNVTSTSGLADVVVNNVNTTAFLTYAESILSQYSISSASFESVNIDVELILNSVFAVQSVFFLFDYIYRVYQTVHLVSRFWRRGVVRLPKVDLRAKNVDVSGPWFKYVGCLLQVLPFFSLQLLLLAAFIIILIWGFAALYVPSLNAYSASCVHHTTNSTFLSRNLDSLAYNYAVSDGNKIVTKGITKFNSKSAGYCMGSASGSLQSYTAVLNSAHEANQTLANSIKSLGQLEQCVDLSALDLQFQRACCSQNDYIRLNNGFGDYNWIGATCGASAYNCPMQPAVTSSLTTSPYLPPGYYTSQAACTTENLLYADAATGNQFNSIGAIRPSAFNCKALPLCEVSCTEPDRATITLWSKHCSCMIEWYANAAILQTLVALLTYIILNISRIIVVEKGILVLWWRDLTPEVFDYIANCDSHGKILNHALQKEGNSEGKSRKRSRDDLESGGEPKFRVALSDAIAVKIAAYERKGWVMIMLGLSINLIWIVLVLELKNDIAYSP